MGKVAWVIAGLLLGIAATVGAVAYAGHRDCAVGGGVALCGAPKQASNLPPGLFASPTSAPTTQAPITTVPPPPQYSHLDQRVDGPTFRNACSDVQAGLATDHANSSEYFAHAAQDAKAAASKDPGRAGLAQAFETNWELDHNSLTDSEMARAQQAFATISDYCGRIGA